MYYGDKDGLSTGAVGDLATATRIARNMICVYGMSESFGLAVIDPQDANAPEIRQEINRILTEQLEHAVSFIQTNRAKIDALVEVLMNNNSMTGEEIDAVLTNN